MIRSELRGDKIRLVGTLVFSIAMISYLSFFTAMILNDSAGSSDRSAVSDFMLITMVPILGFTYSRRSFKYWSEDSYTKMLAYLRSLPVPIRVILCKRKIQALLSFTFNGILYFAMIYGLAGSIREELSPIAYLAFALTWVGFGLAITGIYIVIELLCSGRAYCGYMFVIIGICIGISFLVNFSGGNLMFYSINCSQDGLLSPLMWATLLTGVISMQLFSKWTAHRLKKRDLK